MTGVVPEEDGPDRPDSPPRLPAHSGAARPDGGVISMVAAVAAVVVAIVLAAGCWLRTDAPVLSEVSGISTGAILAQFEPESEPPAAREIAHPGPKPLASIVHPDPLDLSASPLRVVTTAPAAGLIDAIAKAFRDDGFRADIGQQRLLAGAAVNDLCDGHSDVAQIDRLPHPREVESCADRGVEIVAIPVALDRIVLVAHPDNFWLGRVSSDQLESVLTATSWNDVDESWPRRPLIKYVPVPGSSELGAITRAAGSTRSSGLQTSNLAETTYQEDAVDRLTSVAADPEGLAFVAMSDLGSTAIDFVVRPVGVDDALAATSYPMERTVHLLVSEAQLAQRPELATFVAYYLNRVEAVGPDFNLAPPVSLPDARRGLVERLDDTASDSDRGPIRIDDEAGQ